MNKILQVLEATWFGLATFITAIGLVWLLLVQTNYGYSVWHDHGGIAEAIEKFGPQNRFKPDFALTSKEQRLFLFSQIVDAVHNKGAGLQGITYMVKGKEIALLREPEIIHLQDVAKLIHVLVLAIIVVITVSTLFVVFHALKKRELPSLKKQAVGVISFVGLVFLVILLVGWDKLYALLHIWVFPDEHQWFFYYQDSLMSTMMWAPHLFNYIGLVWLVLTLVVFIVLLYLQARFNAWVISRRPVRRAYASGNF